MSGSDVIDGISAVIAIIDYSIQTYKSAPKDLEFSKTFETIGRRLPRILLILRTCQSHLDSIQGSLLTDVCEVLEKTLDTCGEKAAKLRGIFEKVIPGDKDAWKKRYIKVVRKLGKGNKVEELMISITEDVQLIVNHDAVKSAKPEQNLELENIVKEMKSVESSVPVEEGSASTFNSSGGAQTNNVNSGSGQQINNNGPVSTQNFHSGKN